MNPIVQLNLPRLTAELEHSLLEIAKGSNSFKTNNGTILAIKENAQRRGSRRIVAEIDSLQKLYGFDYIPTHKGIRLPETTVDSLRLRESVNTELHDNVDFVVQVIDNENTFIHHDGTSRSCSFYYLLSDDDTAITRFYKTESKPILETVYNPKDVTEVYSIHMNRGCWYLFDHRTIHAVTGVTKPRIGFIVDMTKVHTYDACVEKYKHLIME